MTDNVEHGVEAYYSSDGEQYKPVLSCTCGYNTPRSDSWEEAGQMFDEHVRSIK